MAPTSQSRRPYVLLAVFFFITYAYFFQGGGWNQNGRVCLIRAIIHQHTFSIDNYREDSTDPYFAFVNTGDWSYYNGHYFTNKSPGLSLLAVVPYAIAEYGLRYLFPDDIERQVLFSTYFCNLCTTVLCGVMLCLTLFHILTFFFRFDQAAAVTATFMCGLGTLLFSYSTTLYSHVPAASFSFLSFTGAMHIRYGTARKKKIMALGSGIAASLAVLIEPSTVLTLGLIFLYLLSFREGRCCAAFFLAGCIPAGIVQCYYNAVCFGGPFNSSYDYANDMVMARVNGRLFGFPRLQNIAGLLLLPYRGLFVSSPIYLMALPGLFLLFRQRRAEAVLCTGVSLLFLLYISCFYAWRGGSAVGPRYLVPSYPFAFMLTVFALQRFRKLFILLGLVSIIINLSITIIGNEIPAEVKNPLKDAILGNLLAGKVSINPVPFSNFENQPHIDKLKDTTQWTQNFNSFNLGEVLFPHHIASILPLLLFWLAWWYVWRRWSRL